MEIHHAVEDIYRRNPGAFDDTEHLVSALSDYVDTDGAGAGEIRLIVDAVELGSFQRLRELSEVGASPHGAIAETATTLARNRATDEHRSAWACAVLAYATGLVNDADVRAYRSQWELATAIPTQQPGTYPEPPSAPVLTQSPPHTGSGQSTVPPPYTSPPQPYTSPPQPWTAASYPQTYAPPQQQPTRSGVPRWVFGVLAVVVVLVIGSVVGLVLFSGGDDDPEGEGGGETEVTTPQVGECHALSTADLSGNSDPKPPVPCDDESATTITTDIVTLPDDVDRSSTDAVWEEVGPECAQTTLSYLGGHAEAFARSGWTIAFFVPTAEEADAGADWARCDLTLHAGGETQPLPSSVDNSIDSLPLGEDVALCAEDSASGGLFTTCNQPHAFRATGSLYRTGAVPTDDDLASPAVRKECEGVITGDYAFATAPPPVFWEAGTTYIVCFSWDN